jgi:hypothetical protein
VSSSQQADDFEALKRAGMINVSPLTSPFGLPCNVVGRSWSRSELVKSYDCSLLSLRAADKEDSLQSCPLFASRVVVAECDAGDP